MAITQAPRTRSDAIPLRTYRSLGRPVAIAGIGTYAPEGKVTNQDLERLVNTSDQWIRERTGIVERRVAEPGTPTFELATRAARTALDRTELNARDLDMIIVATSSPDGPFPSVACRVQEQLEAPGCTAFDVLAACAGFPYALSMAEAYIASGRVDTVMVIGAEVLTRFVDWTDRATCVLFGDGAGAVILCPARRGAGFLSWCMGADGRGYDKITCGDVPRGAYAAGQANPFISQKGPDVYKFATDIFIRQAYAVAGEAGLTMDDIDLWIPHQANRRIIEAAANRIGLPLDKVVINIDNFGNSSTATIPLAMDAALADGRLHEGDRVLIAGFGSGLTWAACLMEWE